MRINRIITLALLSLLITVNGYCEGADLKSLWDEYGALMKAGYTSKAALVLQSIGKKQINANKYDDAEKAYAQALKLLGEKAPERTLANIWLEVATLHRKMAQPEIALIELRHAQKIGGVSTKIYLEHARILTGLKKFKEAKCYYSSVFRAIKKRFGKSHRAIAKILAEMSMLYARAGRLKRAKQLAKRGLMVNRQLKDHRVKGYDKRQREMLAQLSAALASRNETVSS